MNMIAEKSREIEVYEVPLEALDASNSGELKETLMSIIRRNPNLVLDLNRLEFVDSSGLGVFLSCLRTANSLGGEIKLCSLTDPVRSLLELVRMYRIFEIYNSPAEAQRAFSG